VNRRRSGSLEGIIVLRIRGTMGKGLLSLQLGLGLSERAKSGL